jgi:hypothetical protein
MFLQNPEVGDIERGGELQEYSGVVMRNRKVFDLWRTRMCFPSFEAADVSGFTVLTSSKCSAS